MNRRFDNSTAAAHRLRRRPGQGMILLELVIGLSIFVIASVFVLDGLTASLRGVSRARWEAEASDLSVTVFSQIHMGQLEMVDAGPNAFEEEQDADWTWQLTVVDPEDLTDFPQLKHVEVLIARVDGEYSHRVAKLLWEDPNAALEEEDEAEVLP